MDNKRTAGKSPKDTAKEIERNGIVLPDLSNIEEARKAFLASEIFQRKY